MLQHKSPKEFWNAAKNLNLGHNKTQNTPKNIPVKEWLSHFKNLMGEPNNNETTPFLTVEYTHPLCTLIL